MDLGNAMTWRPPEGWQKITVIDSHTGGEPFRLVVDGLPSIEGDTVLERRRYAQANLDWLRKALMWEPRGHADMYGGWMVPPERADSDLGILFTHNEGFSTMCGHGIIALAKLALETGILPFTSGETTLRIDTPAGLVVATSTHRDAIVTGTRFENVPSFAAALDATVDVPGVGELTYDLGFGGAFYAFVDADSIGVAMDDAAGLIAAGRAIKLAIMSTSPIDHPVTPELGFLYGVIFTGDDVGDGAHSRHVCVFADGEVDRSPTGTGVSARLALLRARGQVELGEEVTIESITGSRFGGTVARMTEVGGLPAVVPEVSGTAHILGRSEMWIDPDDHLGKGFLIR